MFFRPMLRSMILETSRLVLRPMTMTDAPALFAILGDAEAMEFWGRPPLPRLATVEAQMADELAAMRAGGFFCWTVVKDDDAIGSIDLKLGGGAEAWTGFAFRHDQWGRGLGREALSAVIANAFGPMQLARLMARVQEDNQRAIRLLQGLGFQPDEAPAELGAARPSLRFSLTQSRMTNGT